MFCLDCVFCGDYVLSVVWCLYQFFDFGVVVYFCFVDVCGFGVGMCCVGWVEMVFDWVLQCVDEIFFVENWEYGFGFGD